MKVAIYGSFRESEEGQSGTFNQFRHACRSLGALLATKGHSIVVCSSDIVTADHHVIDGFIGALSGAISTPRVHVVAPRSEVSTFQSWSERVPHALTFLTSSPGHHSGNVAVLKQAEFVITIGGTWGTLAPGLAAIFSGKKVLPIASFGGASVELLEAVQQVGGFFDPLLLGTLRSGWSSQLLSQIGNLLTVAERPRIILIHGRSGDWHPLKDYLQNVLSLPAPLEMAQKPGLGQSLPEKWEGVAALADGAIAVVTPDDMGGLRDGPLYPRARENVWLEVGWFWGRLGRRKVHLIVKDTATVPSDLSGLEYYPYKNSPLEVSESIRQFITQLHE